LRGDHHTYVPAFDGLRGVAILPVIFLHVDVSTLPRGHLLYELTRGWYGVDLFFVLSGFLITWIMLAEIDQTGTIDVKRFYERRFLRLTPAYVSMLIAVLVGAVLLRRPEVQNVPRVLPALITYTYNYQIAAGGTQFDVLVVIWSLCVEEQFYLVWPWVLRRLGTRRALWFCLGAIGTICVYSSALYAALNWGHLEVPTAASSIWIYFATDTRLGVILTGCAAALSLKHPSARRLWKRIQHMRAFPTLALAAACASVIFITGGRPSSGSLRSATLGYTVGASVTAALIAAVFVQPTSPIARFLSWNPLVSLGRVSYGVYLFHPAIAWLVVRYPLFGGSLEQATGGPLARFVLLSLLVLCTAWAIAALHYQYVERWFMSLRRPVAGRAELPGREDVAAAAAPSPSAAGART
jgi:peptidoglycan/LPS O-acetylase OafA/YrhL